MRCRCKRVIHEGDTGWYHQEPVTLTEAPGLTFMDRVTMCDDGQPHSPATVTVSPQGPEKRRVWPGDQPCALCYIKVWHSQAECSKGGGR